MTTLKKYRKRKHTCSWQFHYFEWKASFRWWGDLKILQIRIRSIHLVNYPLWKKFITTIKTPNNIKSSLSFNPLWRLLVTNLLVNQVHFHTHPNIFQCNFHIKQYWARNQYNLYWLSGCYIVWYKAVHFEKTQTGEVSDWRGFWQPPWDLITHNRANQRWQKSGTMIRWLLFSFLTNNNSFSISNFSCQGVLEDLQI